MRDGLNDNCDLSIGPCACGAWHSAEEVEELTELIFSNIDKKIQELRNKKPSSKELKQLIQDISTPEHFIKMFNGKID